MAQQGVGRFRPRIVAGVVLVVALAAGWGVETWLSRPVSAPAAVAPAVTVAAPLRREVTDWTEYTGQFAPVEYVEVRARVSGYLTEIHFTDGQVVQKGDPLFVVDPRPYQNALADAEAKLEQARSSRQFSHQQLGRADALRKKDFVSQSTVDQRVQESRGAGASVDAAEAAVRDAELNLEFTRVTAPVAGRVGARQVSVGNLINGGGATPTLLATIVSLDPIYFAFDMSESDYLALKRARAGKGEVGMPVEIHLSDETGWPFKGRLDFVDNQIDRGSGTIRVRAVLSNPDRFLTPGLFGRVRLAAAPNHPALLIPDAAVIVDQSRQVVMTVAADGTVVPKVVVPGPMADGLREIASGLDPSDRVVIDGLLRARPGAKVTAQPGTIATGPDTAAR
jgi:RND family efflux transporter MFP subunit